MSTSTEHDLKSGLFTHMVCSRITMASDYNNNSAIWRRLSTEFKLTSCCLVIITELERMRRATCRILVTRNDEKMLELKTHCFLQRLCLINRVVSWVDVPPISKAIRNDALTFAKTSLSPNTASCYISVWRVWSWRTRQYEIIRWDAPWCMRIVKVLCLKLSEVFPVKCRHENHSTSTQISRDTDKLAIDPQHKTEAWTVFLHNSLIWPSNHNTTRFSSVIWSVKH